MCGIAGGVSLRPGVRVDADRVRRMSDRIAHRGPDEDGLWEAPDGSAILAHRRLSIIDLTSGQQPMADQNAVIIFNGEIYNYIELRAALEAEGIRFRTNSDTEVLLTLLKLKGPKALSDLRGMYGFAFHDAASGRTILARDRVGKKPLYYTVDGDVLYFASTFNALARTGTRNQPSVDQVDAFLDLGYVPAPFTLDADIRKLPAASMLAASYDGLEVSRFWQPARRCRRCAAS